MVRVRFEEADKEVKRLTEVLSMYERQYGPMNTPGVHVPSDHLQPQQPHPQRPVTQHASNIQPRPVHDDGPRSLHSVNASSFESQISVSDLPQPSQHDLDQMMEYFQRQRQQDEQQQQQQMLEQQRLEQQRLKFQRQRLEQRKIQATQMREQATCIADQQRTEWERQRLLHKQGHMVDEALTELEQARREADNRERMRQSINYEQQKYGDKKQKESVPVLDDSLADDIKYFSDDVCRQIKPPVTAEVDIHVDKNPSLPYPNLVSPRCGKQFHDIREIQKFRETCPLYYRDPNDKYD